MLQAITFTFACKILTFYIINYVAKLSNLNSRQINFQLDVLQVTKSDTFRNT